MRRTLWIVFLGFIGCDDKLSYPSNYPVLETLNADYESGISATFHADVLFYEPKSEIVRYGFIWIVYWDSTLPLNLANQNVRMGIVEDDLSKGTYELFVEDIGRNRWNCYYRAFIETQDKVIYGDIKYFPVIAN